MTIKTKVSYANCSITVVGCEMKCPLCGTLVMSGYKHECSKPETEANYLPPKRKRRISARGSQ